MAFVAQLGRFLEFVIQMASLALRVLVLAQQIEFRFAVVKVSRLPVFFLVTILALRPQTAFMFICLFMTTIALGGSFPIFFHREVAVFAKHFAVQVRAL